MEKVTITQTKSTIGVKPIHRRTLVALGLKKKGAFKTHSLTPQVKGMIDSVKHLIEIKKG